ncbi:MAG: L,D-transpeptidase family protein [Verrucomicrobiales bacterium]
MGKKPPEKKSPSLIIDVAVGEQRLRLREGEKILMTCAISTSKCGLGSAPGSNQTPAGRMRVAEKHGADEPLGTIFKSRQPAGLWKPESPVLADDLITSRILWLEGLEASNATAYQRYIYIHGTNQEHLLGTPASHGCVRMRNEDVVDLFEAVPVGTAVRVH